MRNFLMWAAAAAALPLQGCTSVDGQGIYATRTIGDVSRSVSAVVVATEPVSISSAGSGGSAYGGLIGAGLSSGSDDAVVILAGIVAGAVVGHVVEESLDTHDATKYALRTENGAMLVVAQINRGTEIFEVGDRVRVEYGSPNRLLRESR